jgi:transcriptional regulator with XRE-family HTH domain
MNRIELLIKEKGFNMTSFAEKMNTTRQNLYAILKSPSYPTLEKVAEALDVPMWQLFASPEEVTKETKSELCPHCGQPIAIKTTIEKAD